MKVQTSRVRHHRLPLALGLVFALLFIAFAAHVSAQGPEEAQLDMPPLDELKRALEQRLDEGMRQIEATRRAWEQERERLMRDTERFRVEGEKALGEAMKRTESFLRENEVEIDRGMRAFQESLDDLSAQLQERFRALNEAGARQDAQPDATRHVHVVEIDHRPAGDVAEALRAALGTDAVRVMDDDRLVIVSTPEEWARMEPLIAQLDQPQPEPGDWLVSIYLIAAGLPWDTAAPLPQKLESLRPVLSEIGQGAEPRLLAVMQFRTGAEEGFSGTCYLPDTVTEYAHVCQIAIDRIRAGEDGRIRLEDFELQADIRVGENSRPVSFSASPEIETGKLALIGSASVQGSGQAMVLVGEVVPAP